MRTTKQLPRAEWKDYFDRFTREHLQGEAPDDATIEVMSPTLGDQFEVSAVPLLGLTFEVKSGEFEILLDGIDHVVLHPTEIWILEGEPGFVATIEIVQPEGEKEIIFVRRSGPLAGFTDVPAKAAPPKARGDQPRKNSPR